jgi:hypothetical protein
MAAAMLALVSIGLSAQVFTVDFPAERSSKQMDGRVLLLVSNDASEEPRMQISISPSSQQVFGLTVDGLRPGEAVSFGSPTANTSRVVSKIEGYPHRSLTDMPAGDYTVQAVLNVYQTFHRSDGKTVKLPPDMGEGQHWNIKPGNLYSKPVKVHLAPGSQQNVHLELTQVIPPIKPEPDTKYIRHLRIQSKLLSDFWGTPMYLSAVVMVPEGFDEHQNAHYPLIVFEDHFEPEFFDFRETPPDPNLKPDYSERFHLKGYNRIVQEESYKNYQDWIKPNQPRFLIVKINHANPYYDDSYAVNSANLGPYGDAIETELIPAIEKQFRAIGQGWARFVYGGSTGGWESLAVQMFYPEHYNGVFVACPDPVDFHAYMTADLYDQKNIFWTDGAQRNIVQPAMRNYLGQTLISTPDNVAYEAALGDHGRSGEQFDIWQAVFSPVGSDGYPQPIFDKDTGVIDHNTAAYWHDHYDLDAKLQREWATVGPKLQGKLHIYVGYDDSEQRGVLDGGLPEADGHARARGSV